MNQKARETYQVEDFVMDDSFVNYYFNLNQADRDSWKSWLDLNPFARPISQEAGRMLEELSLRLPEAEFQTELKQLKKALEVSGVRKNLKVGSPASSHIQTSGRTRRRMRYLLLIPFIALVALGIFHLSRSSSSPGELIERVNASNHPIIISLGDQTVVTLAPSSSLKYQKTFDEAGRKVYLQGEAEFNVTKDAKRPFCVYSGELVTTVLGTVFRVRDRKADSLTLVELLSGKLKVETNQPGQPVETVFLAPSERVLYNRLAKKLTKQSWQETATNTDKRATLSFHRDDFESVAAKIKKEFGLTVINLSEKKAWSFTGSFRNSTATEIVENICIVKQLAYEIKADTIFIK